MPLPSNTLRIGLGHDTHRLGPGQILRLGGMDIPHNRQALGHSDADVLLHALIDALLGAAGLGDIGEMFPDTDPRYRGCDSRELMQIAWRRVQEKGFRFVSADCIVFAERPKLGALKQQLRQNLAGLLQATADAVNVKAKTGEGVGPVGREEAIEAQCVVLLQRVSIDSDGTPGFQAAQ